MGQQSKTNKKSMRSPNKGAIFTNRRKLRQIARAKRIQKRNREIDQELRVPSRGWLACRKRSAARQFRNSTF